MGYNKTTGEFLSSDGESRIGYYIFTPDSPPAAVVQISHGMCEYAERYEAGGFVSAMTDAGFVVCANDHIGHGRLAYESGTLGHFTDYRVMPDDLHILNGIVRKTYRSLPYILLGHSMGSFVAREYIVKYSDIDGAVMKLNSLAGRARLGSTAKFPRWAAAFKYPPEIKSTVLEDIVVQVGRTGVLTPRAIVAPVYLAGTTVTSATLHNQDFISEKDVRIGDTVKIRKAGEIIPEILEVELDKRPAGAKPYFLPQFCPVCGAPVERDEDGAALRCTGAPQTGHTSGRV